MEETRRLSGAPELRAMAHPLRLRLIEELGLDGPLTATELAERVDESPSNLSWHLRQLAKHGYVEEVDVPGRRRPWRLTSMSHTWGSELDPDARSAASALLAIVERHDLDARHDYQRWEVNEPEQWREAAFGMSAVAWLTAAELAAIGEAFAEALAPFADRLTDAARRPPDARPARLVYWGHPLRPEAPAAVADQAIDAPDAAGEDEATSEGSAP